MITLDSPDKTLRIVLASSPATELDTFVNFYDVPQERKDSNQEYPRHHQVGESNGTTAADICDAPSQVGVSRNIETVSITNQTGGAVTAIVSVYDGTTDTPIKIASIADDATLSYEHGTGWS